MNAIINTKRFTFESTVESVELKNNSKLMELLSKYFKEAEASSCILKIEEFSNDKDDTLDYDVTIELEADIDSCRSICIKTDSNFEKCKSKFDEIKKEING